MINAASLSLCVLYCYASLQLILHEQFAPHAAFFGFDRFARLARHAGAARAPELDFFRTRIDGNLQVYPSGRRAESRSWFVIL